MKRTVAVAAVVLLTVALAGWLWRSGSALAAALVLVAGLGAAWWVRRKFTPPPPDPPMVSLVLLMKQPRYLERMVLAEIVNGAWGLAIDASRRDAPAGAAFVVGEAPIFMVHTGTGMFVVHNHEQSYFNEAESLAEKVPDLRARSIIADHRAWLSVDALGVDAGEDHAPYYERISKLLADLANDSVLGLYQPASQWLTPWDETLVERLRRGENLSDLFAVQQAPVVQVSEDDSRMKAAVAEARQRWPEFVAAYAARKPDGHYAVKAPITRDGNTEFIWIEVIGLEPEYIHGKLANDPVDLGGLKIGDQVEVALAELNDWSFTHGPDDEPAGLFTVKVVSEAYAQQLKQAQEGNST